MNNLLLYTVLTFLMFIFAARSAELFKKSWNVPAVVNAVTSAFTGWLALVSSAGDNSLINNPSNVWLAQMLRADFWLIVPCLILAAVHVALYFRVDLGRRFTPRKRYK